MPTDDGAGMYEDYVGRQIQYHGEISRITEDGIFVITSDGEEYSLPPELETLIPAKPGEYRLRSTGEVVVNPDFVTSWTINAPQTGEA